MAGTDDEGRAAQNKLPQTQGRRKRTRVFTPDDRATHRVVEKQRREALNTQFIELARLLPGLASTRRLSKSIIVSESIVHQKKQREQRLACAQQLRAMLVEQESLVTEVNALRTQLGIPDRREAGDFKLAACEILEVEKEVFGTFPAGFGDNGEDPIDGDDDMGIEVDEERRDSSRLRRSSRRTASRSMSNTSHRTASRSPASGTTEPSVKAAPKLRSSVSPAAQSAPSPGASTSESPVSPTIPSTAYEGDFLAMFGPGPSLPPQQQHQNISFGFPPTTNMISQSAAFANQLPIGSIPTKEFDLRQPDIALMESYMGGTDVDFGTFVPTASADAESNSITNPNPTVDDIWSFLQEHPGAGIFHTGRIGGFVVGGQYPAPFPPVHVGTHGGFTV